MKINPYIKPLSKSKKCYRNIQGLNGFFRQTSGELTKPNVNSNVVFFLQIFWTVNLPYKKTIQKRVAPPEI